MIDRRRLGLVSYRKTISLSLSLSQDGVSLLEVCKTLRKKMKIVYSRFFFFSFPQATVTFVKRVGVGHGLPLLFLGFSCSCPSHRFAQTIDQRDRSENEINAGGVLSLSVCLPSLFFFFHARADYARLRRIVGDRDEGWVVCRDGIAGAPLIYPFTHPC